jgi:hypothetical protein
MRKLIWGSIPVLLLLAACPPKPTEPGTATAEPTFTYSITTDPQYLNLPALQSFAFGETADAWLFIGGRTNGFHAFPPSDSTFPRKKANKWIYAYTLATNKLDSMSVENLPAPLVDQFSFTNLQHTQVGDYLYLCGGYGATFSSANDTTFRTDSTFSRVSVSQMIAAVQTGNEALLQTSVVYDPTPNVFVCATGGELFKFNDRFYLVVGHRYQGAYLAPTSTQNYLDGVHSFTINETATSIALVPESFKIISDTIGGVLSDTNTQFRRRDLVVSAGIQTNGKAGISIYGGVFTSAHTTPFTHPIYLSIDGSDASYAVDTFNQRSNSYSAANVTLYSKSANKMYTTIFGGIVENKADSNNASFTRKVLTLKHDLTTNTTSDKVEPVELTTANNFYYGAESMFIKSRNIPLYDSDKGIIDLDSLPANQPVVIGRIYGGIVASVSNNNTYQTSHSAASSHASRQVFLVSITKNAPVAASKK